MGNCFIISQVMPVIWVTCSEIFWFRWVKSNLVATQLAKANTKPTKHSKLACYYTIKGCAFFMVYWLH